MRTTMHPAENNTNILIIGGGASGLAAGCIAARHGLSVLLLEKNDKLGKKLLATGNGRCNVMNDEKPVYFGDASFARSVLSYCPPQRVRAFLESLGLVLRQEESGRLYPAGNRADMVVSALTNGLERAGVQIKTGCEIVKLQAQNGLWQALDSQGQRYTAQQVLLAGGGCAAPQLGGTEAMYHLASSLGLSVTPLYPALCALETEKKPLHGLTGLRLLSRLTLCDGFRPVAAAQGEALFSESGLSGVCAMQLARDAAMLLAKGKTPTLYMDFSPLNGLCDARMERKTPDDPTIRYQAMLGWLKRRANLLPYDGLLSGFLPRPLDRRLLGRTLEDTARLLTAFALPVKGVRGFKHAQVTAGGVTTRGIDPSTMRSPLNSLYLAGELLDVDGDCGGFNLLFAFASGILAAEAMAVESPFPLPSDQTKR